MPEFTPISQIKGASGATKKFAGYVLCSSTERQQLIDKFFETTVPGQQNGTPFLPRQTPHPKTK
jgi:hypothetical protein